jgi:hypothetical protein
MIYDRTKKEIKEGQKIVFTLPDQMQDGKITKVELVSSLAAGATPGGMLVNKLFVELCIQLPSHPNVPHSMLTNVAVIREPGQE